MKLGPDHCRRTEKRKTNVHFESATKVSLRAAAQCAAATYYALATTHCDFSNGKTFPFLFCFDDAAVAVAPMAFCSIDTYYIDQNALVTPGGLGHSLWRKI